VVLPLVGALFGRWEVYDLSAWCPALEVEDVDEFGLVGAGLGEHAAGLGVSRLPRNLLAGRRIPFNLGHGLFQSRRRQSSYAFDRFALGCPAASNENCY
jgi:hypothetical protein